MYMVLCASWASTLHKQVLSKLWELVLGLKELVDLNMPGSVVPNHHDNYTYGWSWNCNSSTSKFRCHHENLWIEESHTYIIATSMCVWGVWPWTHKGPFKIIQRPYHRKIKNIHDEDLNNCVSRRTPCMFIFHINLLGFLGPHRALLSVKWSETVWTFSTNERFLVLSGDGPSSSAPKCPWI